MPHIVSLLPIARKVPFDEASLEELPANRFDTLCSLAGGRAPTLKPGAVWWWLEDVAVLPSLPSTPSNGWPCAFYGALLRQPPGE
jgi:hypothetical protein